eukprot:CAMPEP_0194233884 /NCGR_PEP_ID=MMETSP0158-20130606/1735_1 /TAXON_ID=33649 /ORGANISM="Thalassionema nitzschioides, Strain L26-B" /LENGTH=60 /DNA_ID=CAMNT_0038966895 /DNA_START=105 /DNA_END=284 /DNA_ORIENTATION=-
MPHSSSGIEPLIPADWRTPQGTSGWAGKLKILSGSTIALPSPQIEQPLAGMTGQSGGGGG